MKITSIFKKTAVFSLALTLILLMAISVMPLASAADEEISAGFETSATEGETTFGEKLVAMNVSQSGNIKMLFYFTFDNSTLDADDYIEITIPQLKKEAKVMKIAKGDLKDAGNGRYLVEVPVAAAQQTDLVSLQWFKSDDGTVTPGKIRKYSVRYYADRVLNLARDEEEASESNPDTVKKYSNQVNNVISMLNYGAMAQKMFNYNDGTDGEARLANAGLFGESNPIDNMTAANMIGVTTSKKPTPANGVEFLHSQAFLQDTVQLRVYFNAPEGATAKLKRNGEYVGGNDNPTEFKIWTEEGTGYRYVNINNVAAHNFDVKFTVEINVDGKATSMDCSVLEYALRALESYKTTDEQKDTARAIYLYYAWMKNYVTNDTFKPGSKTDSEGNEIECKHERSHIEVDKVVCSDCGYTGYATRLSLTADPVELIENKPTDVAFTIKVDNATNLQALIITLTPDDSDIVTLTFKSMVLGDGSSQTPIDIEGTANLNVVLDSSEPINGSATLATVVYTVNASESGTYKITPTVREAANSNNTDISSTIATSMVTLVVKKPECEEHTVEYDITADGHRGYCEVCQRVFDFEAHTYDETYVEADGFRTYQSHECFCGAKSSDNVEYSYKLGFDLEKNEKAPLLVVTPNKLYKNSSTKLTKYNPADNGYAYITYKNLSGATDSFFYVINQNTEITGKYVAIKYRTNKAGATLFLGANNGNTTASGNNDFFSITSDGKLFASDEQWRVAIIDLGARYSGAVRPEDDGETYSVDYFRLDILEGNKDESIYYDVAYVAFSDDYMSLASFAGNDRYVLANSTNASSYYSSSVITGNPVFDSSWLANSSNSNSGSGKAGILTHTKDTENNNLPYVEFTKQEGGGSDSAITIKGDTTWPMPTTANAKYVGFLYRRNAVSDIDIFINSTHSGANGAGDFIDTDAKTEIHSDNKWHFAVIDASDAMNTSKTAHFDPSKGLASLRFDYWNTSNGVAGDKQMDLAFIGIFETPEQAYAYMGQYAKDYLNVEGGQGCMHDATAKSNADCCTYCEYCGTKTADADHTTTDCKYTVSPTLNESGELYEFTNCAVCNSVIERSVSFIPGLDALRIDGIVANKSPSNAQQTAGRENIKNICSVMDANKIFINADTKEPLVVSNNFKIYGWLGVNSGAKNYVFKINDNEWQYLGKGSDQTDYTAGIGKAIAASLTDVVEEGLGLGAGFQGGMTIPATAIQEYATQTVTFTFGVVPNGCPGTDDNPNVVPFLKIINVFIKCDHSTNTAEYTFDVNDPQHLSATCTTCGERTTTGATNTTGGATAFIGGSNLNITGGSKTEKLTETYGNKLPLNFFRIYSKGSTTEERSTVYSSGTRITTKRYIAMMWRSTVSSSPEIALDTTTKVQRNVWTLSQAGYGATAPVGEWHFGLISYSDHASYSMNGTDTIAAGAGNVTLDYINGDVARTTSDYVDVAFIAFFDSAAEAWEYYNLYAAAYLDEEECQHFGKSEDYNFVATGDGKIVQHCACGKIIDESYCQHYDYEKLTNVTPVENDGIIDYTADCGICGATGVNVDISLPGGTQFFNPGRLQYLTYSHTTSKKNSLNFPILKDANGLSYIQYQVVAAEENYVFLNTGATNLENGGKLFAMMYRTEDCANTQMYLNKPGTTNEEGARSPSCTLTKDGNWGLAIFDFTGWIGYTDTYGNVRLDIINSSSFAAGSTIDIAWAGFFNTRDEANDYFGAYLDKYEIAEHVCSPAYDWERGADIFTYNQVCYVCGKPIGEAVSGITEHGNIAWSPEDIKALPNDNNTTSKSLTLMTDNDTADGMPFVRIQATEQVTAERFIYLNSDAQGKINNAGKVVAFIYRNKSGSNGIFANEMFARFDDSIGANTEGQGNNVYSRGYMKESANMRDTTWSLGYFDFTSKPSYDTWRGLGAMRWDIFNANGTINAGDYIDVAGIATFNSVDEAIEFYDSFANEYNFDVIKNRYCFDSLKVGGTSVVAGDKGWKNTTNTYDVSNITVGTADAQFINIGGWYLNPYGTDGYYYRVTDENGAVSDLIFIQNGTNEAPGSKINDVGKNLGYNADLCGIGAKFGFSLNYHRFTEYEGQKITVELIAKHISGREAVMVTLKNIYVCVHDLSVVPVIENDGNADGKLYESATCSKCSFTNTSEITVKGWLDYDYFDGVKMEGNTGSLKSLKTIDANSVASVKVIAPSGWTAVNNGIAKYVYRVNGGEWQAVVGSPSNASSGILADSGVKTLINPAKNAAFGSISTADLSLTYAGQTVTVEFALVPDNNPGTDAAPNAHVFLAYENVHVATPTVPNYVIDANALKGTTEHTGLTYALDASGDFVTYTQKTDGSSDCYFYATFPNNGVNVPSAPTGKYVLVKYRTTSTLTWQMYVGANWNNYTTAQGGDDSFSLNVNDGSNNGAIIADGKWQYLILDLKFVEAWGGVNPEDGTTDTYQIDYFRIDLFNAASDVANTVDIAYVAYADSVDKLVDYAGMTSYTFGDSYSGGVVGQTVVVGE